MDISSNEVVATHRTSSRPIIGIGAHSERVKFAIFDMETTFAPQRIVNLVAAAGCVPVLLPPLPGVEHAISTVDGLLLIGGPDIDPALFSAAPHPAVVRLDPARDAAEMALLGAALDAAVPVLGICRGLQILNVLRKGTLHQHLPDLTGNDDHSPPGVDVFAPQQVRLEPGSHLARAFGGERTTVPCHHHQAIDKLGVGLSVTARSGDGIIEGVELTDHPFAVAVQWHAEESEDHGMSLFHALAQAARHAAGRARR